MSTDSLRARATSAAPRTDRTPARQHDAEVARTDEQPPTLMTLVEQLKPELARALPKHVSADRIVRIALTAIRRTPELQNCSTASFLGALMTAAQLGLEVNTPAGEAYLIPYNRECTFVMGYQGLAKLFWQSSQAKHLDAQAVHERDEFDYEYGLEPRLRHRPARGDRGPVIAYYAVASLSNGGSAFVVLSPDDVKALRGRTGPNGGVKDPQHWMDKKTAVRQVLKLLPKTVELAAAVAADEQVRTDYTSSLDTMTVREPIDGEVVPAEVDTATGEVHDQPDADQGTTWPPTAQIPAGDQGAPDPGP